MQIDGKVLGDQEYLEDANIADSDEIIYEIAAVGANFLKNNNFYVFIPKAAAQKEKRSKNSVIQRLGKGAEDMNEE